jgi:3-oxoacyl-[acyl-carrier protein] reductase
MEVLESTEKMDLGLQRRAAIVAASKECFSSAVKQPADGLPLSNSVRVAATGLARTPANEFAPFGITVKNVLSRVYAHGTLDTLAKSIFKRLNVKPEEVFAGWAREIPAGLIGTPEEFAAVAAYPASPRAGYENGHFLPWIAGWCGAPSSS